MIVLVMCALQTYFITCIFSGTDRKDAVTDTHFTKLRAKQMKEQQKAVFKDDDETEVRQNGLVSVEFFASFNPV